jgi:hypothetical protein
MDRLGGCTSKSLDFDILSYSTWRYVKREARKSPANPPNSSPKPRIIKFTEFRLLYTALIFTTNKETFTPALKRDQHFFDTHQSALATLHLTGIKVV